MITNIINIVCTIFILIATLFNLMIFNILHERIVAALEKDITRILKDKRIC